jgi:hypothetical protein
MKVHFVSYDDENGDDLGLFVSANSYEQAVGLWQRYYELEDDIAPKAVYIVPPAGREAGAHSWFNIGTAEPSDG